MKVERLALVTAKENHDYVKDFEALVSEISPSLSCPQVSSICTQRPVVGSVLNDCFGYRKSLSVTRLEAFKEAYNGLWLGVRHLNNRYGLGIGSLGNSLEIFKDDHGRSIDEYYLGNHASNEPSKDPRWVVISRDFSQRTFDLLSEASKREFENLVK